MRPKSNTLFHFTKSRDILKLVLKNGFWPRYCLEDVGWLGYAEHDFVAYPIVCFCEIPLSRISEHVGFYGSFGLGLTREWAETNGLNPLMYVAGDNHVAKAFRETSRHSFMLPEGEGQEGALTTTRYLIAHAKPAAGNMLVDGGAVQKVFYQESEWRYVPKSKFFPDHLTRRSFDDIGRLNDASSLTKQHSMLKFNPRDVRYIFVRADSDIPDLVNFIMSELDQYAGSDQKILVSRILSLEALNDDL